MPGQVVQTQNDETYLEPYFTREGTAKRIPSTREGTVAPQSLVLRDARVDNKLAAPFSFARGAFNSFPDSFLPGVLTDNPININFANFFNRILLGQRATQQLLLQLIQNQNSNRKSIILGRKSKHNDGYF